MKKDIIETLYHDRSLDFISYSLQRFNNFGKHAFETREDIIERLTIAKRYIRSSIVPNLVDDEKALIITHSQIPDSLMKNEGCDNKLEKIHHGDLATASSIDFQFKKHHK